MFCCSPPPGELTFIPLLLPDNTNNSLTSLPLLNNSWLRWLFHNNRGPWKPVNNQQGLLWNLFTETSARIRLMILKWVLERESFQSLTKRKDGSFLSEFLSLFESGEVDCKQLSKNIWKENLKGTLTLHISTHSFSSLPLFSGFLIWYRFVKVIIIAPLSSFITLEYEWVHNRGREDATVLSTAFLSSLTKVSN